MQLCTGGTWGTCAGAIGPSAETCNTIDDDCDGSTDEGNPGGGGSCGTAVGACTPGTLTCTGGTLVCTGAGGPSAEEWQRACEASSGSCDWSFASSCASYPPNATTCNGNDTDPSPESGDQDLLLAAGALSMCYASWGGAGRVFDLSGNAEEWTQARSSGVNPVRGGSYNDTSGGMRCDFDFVVANDTFQVPNVGFRCCRSTEP